MFGIGGTELFIILLFAFLIFGPDKMPQIGRTIGRAMRQFRNAQDEMNKVIKSEVYDPLNDKDPLKNPFDSATGAKKKSNTAQSVAKEETFAERKARMTREKAAARAAKEGGAKPQTEAASASATATSGSPASSKAEVKAESAPAKPTASSKSKVDALYSSKPKSEGEASKPAVEKKAPASDMGEEGRNDA